MKKNVKIRLSSLLGATLVVASPFGHALTIDGHKRTDSSTLTYRSAAWQTQMQQDGLQALYLFNETSGQYLDTSGIGTPLNLLIEDPSPLQEVVRSVGTLDIRFPTLIRSVGPATKINRACKASNEFTVEAWIQNENDGQLPPENPMRRIVTLSTEKNATQNAQLSSKHPNFFMSLVYDNMALFRTAVRTSQTPNSQVMLSSDGGIVQVKKLQHIIFSKDRTGVARLYVSFFNDDGNVIQTLRNEYSDVDELQGANFSNWDDNAVLGIGNEISYRNAIQANRDLGNEVNASTKQEQNPWLGKMHLLAIYCKAQRPVDVLGLRAPGQPVYKAFSIDPNMSVTPEMQKAALLYKRLAGVSTSLANPLIAQMAADIAQGNLKGAAARVTNPANTSDFFNFTVRDFAALMATREETVNTPFNDFIATVIGIARDDVNAKQMLTADYLYEGDLTKAAVPANKITDIISSNNHYAALETGRFDLQSVIKRVSPQVLYDGLGNLTPNLDAAGVLTSRAWMEAHAVAGTNRRLVEYAFRQFLCVPLDQWADSEAPDNFVGRDIDRFPAGDHSSYTTSCRSCHSVMDPLRGAFAYYDFSNGFVKHTFRVTNTTNQASESMTEVKVWQGTSVVRKMNHNETAFANGHVTRDNTFKKHATSASNSAYFGWGDRMEGAGVNQFGQMIADAQAFPFCMAKRAFRSTCKREPASIDKQVLESAATAFKQSNYNLKTLFQTIAISEECLGEDL
jgi:hypothetical protein